MVFKSCRYRLHFLAYKVAETDMKLLTKTEENKTKKATMSSFFNFTLWRAFYLIPSISGLVRGALVINVCTDGHIRGLPALARHGGSAQGTVGHLHITGVWGLTVVLYICKVVRAGRNYLDVSGVWTLSKDNNINKTKHGIYCVLFINFFIFSQHVISCLTTGSNFEWYKLNVWGKWSADGWKHEKKLYKHQFYQKPNLPENFTACITFIW